MTVLFSEGSRRQRHTQKGSYSASLGGIGSLDGHETASNVLFFVSFIIILFNKFQQVYAFVHLSCLCYISWIWNICTTRLYGTISLPTLATLLLMVELIGGRIRVSSQQHGAVSFWVLLSCPSQAPGRCCWCGYWAVEQRSRWQFQVADSINSLRLSRSFSSFSGSEASRFRKKGNKVMRLNFPHSDFTLFRIINEGTDFDLGLLVTRDLLSSFWCVGFRR